MHWTDSRRGWVVYTAMCTPFIRRGFEPHSWHFLVIFLLNYYFLFYFINKNNQCNVCKYKYYLTTHTHMSEVEVYSVNKLTFWAMDKNVVGKQISPPGRPPASSNACKTDKVMWLCVYNHGMNGDCVVKRSVELTAVTRQMWKTRFGMI